jgi:ribonucleoside-triphosphate reductase (formate)
MFELIKTGNSKIVKFDPTKITSVIAKAGRVSGEFGKNKAGKLTNTVISQAHEMRIGPIPEVEQAQDIVENDLPASPSPKTAKTYVLHSQQHAGIQAIAGQASVDLVENYLRKMDWKIRENSNMTYSLQGLNGHISSAVTTEYWLDCIYPQEIRAAHKNGDFHIHDLNLFGPYCVGWDLEDLLSEGFRGVGGKVESRPAKHFRSALGQIVNFFYTLQGEAAGAQALSNFDTFLAPFVRYDNLDYLEVKQAVQEFIFNINIPTRVGFQTPFTNITLDLVPPPTLKDRQVIVGGTERKETYSEFKPEMDMINKAFAEIMMEGDAKGRVFTFPIPTYKITADFDWHNPNLDIIWKITGKYGLPYFSNFVNSDMSPDDSLSMCCRLRLDKRELMKRGGGLFGAYPLTGSIGVVTINLPRIGYLANDEGDFYQRIRKMVLLAKESLSIKRNILEKFTENNLYPYSKFYLRKIKERTDYFWKHHFSTIGVIGMNEACINFLGKDIGSEEGLAFSIRVMDVIRSIAEDVQEETGDLFNLEATPAEGASYRLAMLDKHVFSDIVCANEGNYHEGAAPFYTNSTQLPVNYTDDIFQTLTLQDELQTKYTGGTVLHMYLGEEVEDFAIVRELIMKVVSNFRLPYFTLTPTFSVCAAHGYLKGKQERCPRCDAETEVYSRVVGYFRPIKQWNDGKQAEFSLRKAFKLG